MLVKIGSTGSTTLQLRIPEPYCKSQQRAERWGLLQALGVVVRRRLHPTAICADNMGSILADFRCSAPCADFWLVRLAQRLVRLLVRHFPACALSHVAGKLNPADLGTRCLLSPCPGKWFDTPASILALHHAALDAVDAFTDPATCRKRRDVPSLFPAGGPFWAQPPANYSCHTSLSSLDH